MFLYHSVSIEPKLIAKIALSDLMVKVGGFAEGIGLKVVVMFIGLAGLVDLISRKMAMRIRVIVVVDEAVEVRKLVLKLVLVQAQGLVQRIRMGFFRLVFELRLAF